MLHLICQEKCLVIKSQNKYTTVLVNPNSRQSGSESPCMKYVFTNGIYNIMPRSGNHQYFIKFT